ncbi:hypothetical protein [Endozoicomonas atrinae]|uniref:hypothetical protein n=1 Tax=Endozoicomonas atrinae TaxID=1333660 RepID=UPI001EE74B4B|nr:hypothetical protein [Endozoicomonas atrinae]
MGAFVIVDDLGFHAWVFHGVGDAELEFLALAAALVTVGEEGREVGVTFVAALVVDVASGDADLFRG